MSDSDEDLLTNSVFPFPNDGSTIVSARGPGINISNMKVRDNFTAGFPRMMESTRYNASNFERQRQRRDISPMSVASACDARFRFNSYYQRGMSSQTSVYNGRSGSPMSTRTCDTNATLTATDVLIALKNEQFTDSEKSKMFYMLKKSMKNKHRRRIERRRKRMLLSRRSHDSAASLSPSSDDNQSIKTTGYRPNMSSCRSTKTDISSFKRTILQSNIYKDSTENFRQNSSRIYVNRPTSNSTLMSINSASNMTKNFREPRTDKNVFVFGNQSNFLTQKERFQSGFMLPSQRFDKSIARSTIQETQRNPANDTDSDDNIFAMNTHNDTLLNRKRRKDDENDILPDNKRHKVISPCKNSTEAKNSKETDNTNNLDISNDFVFAKPSLPIRKTVKEKLISQSAPPVPDIVISETTDKTINKEIIKDNEEVPHITNITQTDVSMRPSFIKRKLFTQKLDVAENKNISSDNLAANSPQGSIYSVIQKEKNKARKLVTNQSCLNREIDDENNLLDLIHKIVPPNSMNVTTQSNKTQAQSRISNNIDKWDVSSIISKDVDDCSDTYTDEDIFNGDINNTVKEAPTETEKKNVQNDNKKVPNTENVAIKDKNPISDKIPSTAKPISDKVKNKERLDSTKVTCKNNNLISNSMPSKDKNLIPEKVSINTNPASTKVLNKEKLITEKLPNEYNDISEKLPNNQHNIAENSASVFAKPNIVSSLKKHTKTCKILVSKMPADIVNGVKNCVKRFWDTDYESDNDFSIKSNNFKENNESTKPQEKVASQFQRTATIFKKPTPIKDPSNKTLIAETTHRFNTTSYIKIRSHRATKPKRCCDDNKENNLKSYFDITNKKQKTSELPDTKKIDDKDEMHKNNINTTKKQTETKKGPTKILRTPPRSKQNKNNNIENINPVEAKSRAKKLETTNAEPKKQNTKTQKKPEPEKSQNFTQTKDKELQNKRNEKSKGTKTPPNTKTKNIETPKTKTVKNTRYQKILLEYSSLTNSSLEDANKTRPIRSCRLNSSASSSNSTMTLRPRKTSKVQCINLSSPINGRYGKNRS